MSLALVHDYLSQSGGAERVVLELAAMFPEAPIYTSFYAPDRTFPQFRERDVRTTRLQDRVDPDRFRSAVLRYPSAFRALDLGNFETVVVSSSGFAHHIVHPRSFVYCHTPPRFLYDLGAYRFHPLVQLLSQPALALLRRADRRSAAPHLSYAANSAATVTRIRAAYGRQPFLIHPPLWTGHLPAEPLPLPPAPRALVVSRLLPYKRVDVAIRACALARIPLTIVGEGPEESRLRAEAGAGEVRFLGVVDDEEFPNLFRDHSVVLAPGREDFGYLPVEANYAGRPVLALAAGGALETVTDGITGQLVVGDDHRAWAVALTELHQREWQAEELRRATERFQAPRFRADVGRWLATTGGHAEVGAG